jgi:hypothetical protein
MRYDASGSAMVAGKTCHARGQNARFCAPAADSSVRAACTIPPMTKRERELAAVARRPVHHPPVAF